MSAPEQFAIGSRRWVGLSKLIEEAGEVTQVAGKLLATGGDVKHWDGTDLAERLTEELGDLQAAVEFVVFMNPEIDSNAVGRRAGLKRATFRDWHDEQLDAEDGES